MERFILGPDSKPCLWPTPRQYHWTGRRFEKRGPLTLWADPAFEVAAEVFLAWLDGQAVRADGRDADIQILRVSSPMAEEAYKLSVTGDGIVVEAAHLPGARHGLATLYQLMAHSPDPSVHGVKIEDEPVKPFRGVFVTLPVPECVPHFKRFVDVMAQLKLNKLVLLAFDEKRLADEPELRSYIEERGIQAVPLVSMTVSAGLFPADTGERILYNRETGTNQVMPAFWQGIGDLPGGTVILDGSHGRHREDTGSCEYFTERGFDVVFNAIGGPLANWEAKMANPKVRGALASLAAFLGGEPISDNGLYGVLKAAQVLWSPYKTDHTVRGYQLPIGLEKTVYQLYPRVRDHIAGMTKPSRDGRYVKINIREYYNAPLTRTHWRYDDYYFNHLYYEKNLPNTIPFDIVQGVADPVCEFALIAAGGEGYPERVTVSVGRKALSLAFMHAAVPDKPYYQDDGESYYGRVVGKYAVRYADGSEAADELVFGRDIGHWKNYYGENTNPVMADPVMYGINEAGLRYTAVSHEWVNPHPDKEIASVEIIGTDVQVIVAGITAIVEGRARPEPAFHPAYSSRLKPLIPDAPLIWPVPAVMTLQEGHFVWDEAKLRITKSDDLDLGEEGYRLAVTPEQLRWRAGVSFRGLESLPVRW